MFPQDAVGIYLELSAAEIEQHLKYVQSDANGAAKSGRCKQKPSAFFNDFHVEVRNRQPNDQLCWVCTMPPLPSLILVVFCVSLA